MVWRSPINSWVIVARLNGGYILPALAPGVYIRGDSNCSGGSAPVGNFQAFSCHVSFRPRLRFETIILKKWQKFSFLIHISSTTMKAASTIVRSSTWNTAGYRRDEASGLSASLYYMVHLYPNPRSRGAPATSSIGEAQQETGTQWNKPSWIWNHIKANMQLKCD
jgi:hypothetical protein